MLPLVSSIYNLNAWIVLALLYSKVEVIFGVSQQIVSSIYSCRQSLDCKIQV